MCRSPLTQRFWTSVKPIRKLPTAPCGHVSAFNPLSSPLPPLSTFPRVPASVLAHGARSCGMSSESALPLVGILKAKPPDATPIWDLVHPLHTNLLLARLCHRNCATPPAEWPHFLYGSAPLANAVGGRSRLRRYRVLDPMDWLLTLMLFCGL